MTARYQECTAYADGLRSVVLGSGLVIIDFSLVTRVKYNKCIKKLCRNWFKG